MHTVGMKAVKGPEWKDEVAVALWNETKRNGCNKTWYVSVWYGMVLLGTVWYAMVGTSCPRLG